MSRKPYSLNKQLIVVTTLALGAPGVALADDSSMSRFGGDSYNYFNQPVLRNAAAAPAWRQSHPNGFTELELQVLSSSSLAASAFQADHPVVASVAADPLWRQSHPNGLTERELQALSSSTLASWQIPGRPEKTASASSEQSDVAQITGKEPFSTRFARFFRRESGSN